MKDKLQKLEVEDALVYKCRGYRGGRNKSQQTKSQMIIWYFARLIIIIIVIMFYATSWIWFSSHKDVVRISAIIWLYTNLHSTQHMTLVWSSSINCNVFCTIFLCTLRGSALLVFYNKQLLPSIIYLSDLHSLHRCLGYISPPVEIGDGGGHQPVGLNAGIVYNSDPTSRISNYILICIQPNIWRM